MKLRLSCLTFSVGIAISSIAYSEPPATANHDQENAVSSSYQNSHFYLGGRLGWAAYQDACASSAAYCDNDTLGLGIYGGYQFNNWFALEGGIASYGSPKAHYAVGGSVKTDIDGSEFTMKLSLPLTEHMSLFSRLGGIWQHSEKNVSQMQKTIESNEWDILSTLGVSYRISPNWSLRWEYQFIDGIGNDDVNQADLHFSSVGLTYKFGKDSY